MKCKYCDETLGDEDSHGCMALERKKTPADKSPREFLVPSSWQIGGPKVESGDCVAVAKEDYLAVKQELEAAREDVLFLKLEINSYKIAAKGRQESEENLKRWLTETEKQAVDAFAQIKDYESALNKINTKVGSCPFSDADKWGNVLEMVWTQSRNALNKWRAK